MFHLSSPLYTPSRIVVLTSANVTVLTAAVWLLALTGSSSAAPATRPVRALSTAPAPVAAVTPRPTPRTARPMTKPKQVPRPQRVVQPKARRHAPTRRPRVQPRPLSPTPPAPVAPRLAASSWSADFDAAIRRIPGYRSGDARWVVTSSYGSWGTADWYRDIVYVSPRVPRARLYDVAVHEWSHLLSVRPYGGDVDEAVRAMNSYFGGSGLAGAERAADCMALLQGAQWTNYTPCTDASWRAGAARLMKGAQL